MDSLSHALPLRYSPTFPLPYHLPCPLQKPNESDKKMIESGKIPMNGTDSPIPTEWIQPILRFSEDLVLNEIEAGKFFVYAADQLWYERSPLRRGLPDDITKAVTARAFELHFTQRVNLLQSLAKFASVFYEAGRPSEGFPAPLRLLIRDVFASLLSGGIVEKLCNVIADIHSRTGPVYKRERDEEARYCIEALFVIFNRSDLDISTSDAKAIVTLLRNLAGSINVAKPDPMLCFTCFMLHATLMVALENKATLIENAAAAAAALKAPASASVSSSTSSSSASTIPGAASLVRVLSSSSSPPTSSGSNWNDATLGFLGDVHAELVADSWASSSSLPTFASGAQAVWALFLRRVSVALPHCQIDDEMVTRTFYVAVSGTSLYRTWSLLFLHAPSYRPIPLVFEVLGIFVSQTLTSFPVEYERILRDDEVATQKAARGPVRSLAHSARASGPLDAASLFTHWFFVLLTKIFTEMPGMARILRTNRVFTEIVNTAFADGPSISLAGGAIKGMDTASLVGTAGVGAAASGIGPGVGRIGISLTLQNPLLPSFAAMVEALCVDPLASEELYIRVQQSARLPWDHVFKQLDRVLHTFAYQQPANGRPAAPPPPLDHATATVLQALLQLIRAVTRSRARQETLVSSPDLHSLHTLFGLLTCRFPTKLKAQVLLTIRALAEHNPKASEEVWRFLEASRIIDLASQQQHQYMFPAFSFEPVAGVSANGGDPMGYSSNYGPSSSASSASSSSALAPLSSSSTSSSSSSSSSSMPSFDSMRGLLHDLHVVEARQRSFPLAQAFVELILTIYAAAPPPANLGEGRRAPGIATGVAPYIEFIHSEIFVKLDGFQFESIAQRYRIAESCLALFTLVLNDFDVEAFHFPTRAPLLADEATAQQQQQQQQQQQGGMDGGRGTSSTSTSSSSSQAMVPSGMSDDPNTSIDPAVAPAVNLMLSLVDDSSLLHVILNTITRVHAQLVLTPPGNRYIDVDQGAVVSGAGSDSDGNRSNLLNASASGVSSSTSSSSSFSSSTGPNSFAVAQTYSFNQDSVSDLLRVVLTLTPSSSTASSSSSSAPSSASSSLLLGDKDAAGPDAALLASLSLASPSDVGQQEARPTRELVESTLNFALRVLSTALSMEKVFIPRLRDSRFRVRVSMLSDLVARGRGSIVAALWRLVSYEMTATPQSLTFAQRLLLATDLKTRLDEEFASRARRAPFDALPGIGATGAGGFRVGGLGSLNGVDVDGSYVSTIDPDGSRGMNPSYELFNELFGLGLERLVPDVSEISLYSSAITRHLCSNVRRPDVFLTWLDDATLARNVIGSFAACLRSPSYPLPPRLDPAFDRIVAKAIPPLLDVASVKKNSALAVRLQREGERVALAILSPAAVSTGGAPALSPGDFANRNRIALVQMLIEGLDTMKPTFAHALLGFDTSTAPTLNSVKRTDLVSSRAGACLDAIIVLASQPQFASNFPVLGAAVFRLVHRLSASPATSRPFLTCLQRRYPLFLPCALPRLPTNLNEAADKAAADMPFEGALSPVRITAMQALYEQRAWVFKTISLALHTATSSFFVHGGAHAISSVDEDAVLTLLTSLGFVTTEASRAATVAAAEAFDSATNIYNMNSGLPAAGLFTNNRSAIDSAISSDVGSSGVGFASTVQNAIATSWVRGGYGIDPRRRAAQLLDGLSVALPSEQALVDPLGKWLLRDCLVQYRNSSQQQQQQQQRSGMGMAGGDASDLGFGLDWSSAINSLPKSLVRERDDTIRALEVFDANIAAAISEAYAGWDRVVSIVVLRCIHFAQETYNSGAIAEADSGPATIAELRGQLLDLLTQLFTSIVSTRTVWMHLSESLAGTSLVVSSCLRSLQQPAEPTDAALEHAATRSSLVHVFEQLVQALVLCRVQVGRARLYVAFCNLVHYISDDAAEASLPSAPVTEVGVSLAQKAAAAAPEVYQAIVRIVTQAGDRLVKVAASDASDAQDNVRTLALTFATTLMAFAPTSLWVRFAVDHGLVDQLISDISSAERQQIIKVALTSPTLRHYVVLINAQTSLTTLTEMARTEEGAITLLEHRVLDQLAAYTPFSHRPQGRSAVELAAPAGDGPRPLQRYHSLLISGLRLVLAMLVRMPQNIDLHTAALGFIKAHEAALTYFLRDEHNVVFVSSLSVLQHVVALIYEMLSGPLFMGNPAGAPTTLTQLEPALLRLVLKYSSPETFPQLKRLIAASTSTLSSLAGTTGAGASAGYLNAAALASSSSSGIVGGSVATDLPLAALLEDAPMGCQAVDICGEILRLSLSSCVVLSLFRQKRAEILARGGVAGAAADAAATSSAGGGLFSTLSSTSSTSSFSASTSASSSNLSPGTLGSSLLFKPEVSNLSALFSAITSGSTQVPDLALLVSLMRNAAATALRNIEIRNVSQRCLDQLRQRRQAPRTILRGFAKEALQAEADLYLYALHRNGETPVSLGVVSEMPDTATNTRRVDSAKLAGSMASAFAIVRSIAQARLRSAFAIIEQASYLIYHHLHLVVEAGADPVSAAAAGVPFLPEHAKAELLTRLQSELVGAGGLRRMGGSSMMDVSSSSSSSSALTSSSSSATSASSSSGAGQGSAADAPLALVHKVFGSVEADVATAEAAASAGMGGALASSSGTSLIPSSSSTSFSSSTALTVGGGGSWSIVERGFGDIAQRNLVAESMGGAGYELASTGTGKIPLALVFIQRILRRIHQILNAAR